MHFSRNLLLSFLLISFSSITLNAFEDDFESLLSEITEIATKNKLNIDHTPGIVSIISGDELMKMGISHFDRDALNMIPGISNMYSRKSNDFAKYLFQINGISINTEVTGVGSKPLISTKSIKRIEIIRGASSALHGTSAYTALINIITKQDENVVWLDYTNYSSSNHDKSVGALLHHKIDEVDLSLRLHALNADGLDQTVTQDGASLYGLPSNTPSKVSNGKEAYDIGLNIKYENWTLDYERISVGDYAGYGKSGLYLPKNDDKVVHSEIKDILEISNKSSIDDLQITTKLGYMHFDQDINNMYLSPAYTVRVRAKEQNLYAGVELNHKFGDHDILIGGRYFHSNLYQVDYLATIDFRDGSVYAEPSDVGGNISNITRGITSVYLQDYYNVSDTSTLVANLRYDHVNDIDQGVFSPRLALIHDINDNNIIKMQYAKAYLIPQFYPLYANPNTTFIQGDPNLEIDEAHTYELSHIYKDLSRSLKSTFYYVDMFSIDTFGSAAGTTTIDVKNSKQSAGTEIEYNENFDYIDLKANVSYNFYSNIKYLDGDLYNDEIMRLPDLLANLIIKKDITSKLSTVVWYNYIGEQEGYSTIKVSEKHLINLNLTYLSKLYNNDLSVTLSANDILDQRDADVPYANSFKAEEYNNNTRRYMVQVKYIF